MLEQARAYVDERAGPDLSTWLPAMRVAAADEPDHDRLAASYARHLSQARRGVAEACQRRDAARKVVESVSPSRGFRKRADHRLDEARAMLSAAEENLTQAARQATLAADAVRRLGPATEGAVASRLQRAEQAQVPVRGGWRRTRSRRRGKRTSPSVWRAGATSSAVLQRSGSPNTSCA